MKKSKYKLQESSRARTLVIGDVHGSAKALSQVLDRAYVSERDKIIQLGDIADGWSETSECVDILLDLQKTNEVVLLRGNHDIWCYDWMIHGRSPMMWTQQGGQATLDNYIKTGMFMYNEHQMFWARQEDWHIDEQNRIFIHAGWDYKSGPFPESAKYPVNAGTLAKEAHWDRSLLYGAKSAASTKTRFKATAEFKEVYIGHTATESHLPEKFGNLYNIDSGAGWHGKLTIMDVDTKEYWQSDYSKDLYPDEKGR